MRNFRNSAKFLKRLISFAAISAIVALISAFSCDASSFNEDDGQAMKVVKATTGFMAAQIEPAMFFMYGVGNLAHRSLSWDIILGVVASRAPLHMSRLATSSSIIKDLNDQTGNGLVGTAKMFHSLLNEVFPAVYIGIRAEERFPSFAAVTILALSASNFIKGIEYNDCLANRLFNQNNVSKQSLSSLMLVACLSIPKALMIQAMASNTLDILGCADENSQHIISSLLAVASSTLTVAFESDKIEILQQRLGQAAIPILIDIAQAAIIASSVYYGVGSELGLSTLLTTGVFILASVVEAVSLSNHWSQNIIPTIFRWLGF